ncbi:MAG TPA: glycosyltransferase [Myxococcales bacterium]
MRPLLALASRAKKEGHEVGLLLSPVDQMDWAAVCRGQGLEVTLVPEKVEKSLEAICAAAQSADPTQVSIALLDQAFFPYLEAMYAASLELCKKSDVVVGLFSSWYVKAACLKTGVPFACVHYYPGMVPSREVPPVGLGFPEWRWLNPIAWGLLFWLLDMAFKKPAQKFWAEKGLPPIRRAMVDAEMSELLNIVGTSRALFSPPSDWGGRDRLVGHLSMPGAATSWAPAGELERFLNDGPKPVFMSLGTMEHFAPARAKGLLTGAAKAAGVRAVIQTKVGGEGRDGDLYFLRWVPHEVIVPRCSAMVVHGGAGTTHAALKAGVPAVPVPFIFEQGAWGGLLHRAGSATKPLKFWKATPETLGANLRQAVTSEAMAAKAAELAAIAAKEDGTGDAVRALERVAGGVR